MFFNFITINFNILNDTRDLAWLVRQYIFPESHAGPMRVITTDVTFIFEIAFSNYP